MKVIIVGGVAGGASCAARLRRLDEKAEILMVERGPYVSYANCGLPYHISGVIPQESSLLVANEQVFRALYGIDVRTSCEAVAIDPKKKTVDLKNVETGEVTTEATTSSSSRPGPPRSIRPCPASTCPGSFTCGPCPTREPSKSGSREAPTSWRGCPSTRGSSMSSRRRAPS